MQPQPKVTINFEENDINVFVPISISSQNDVGDSTTPSHQDCGVGEQTDKKDAPTIHGQQEGNLDGPGEAIPHGEEKDNNSDNDDDNDRDCNNAQNQLVVYNPASVSPDVEIFPDPKPINCLSAPSQNRGSKISPSIGAFTVQCAICFKWRFIPSKEKYEEIREHLLEHPFICEAAREWRPEISCNDDPDIRQDGSRLWAIDKPNIAQPPSGWERLLRIRGFGGTRFADVYYVAPSGKRLRSMVEVQRYLLEHPNEAEGVALSQFSFQIPRPLQESYVQKRSARAASPDRSTAGMQGDPITTEAFAAKPVAWLPPEANTDLQLGMLEYNAQYNAPQFECMDRPAKKLKQPSRQAYNGAYTF